MYLAKVKFPSEGSWTYQVDDGFSQTHSFAAVQIGPAAATGLRDPGLDVGARRGRCGAHRPPCRTPVSPGDGTGRAALDSAGGRLAAAR